MATERVTCFEESRINDMFGTRTWVPARRLTIDDVCRRLNSINSTGGAKVMDRPDADKTEGWRHIATYTLINIGGHCVVAYLRGSSGGEDRLHRKRSVGFGGHYTVEDQPVETVVSVDSVTDAAGREVDEEVRIHSSFLSRYVGLILSSESPVDRAHVGLCYELCIWPDKSPLEKVVTPAEDCIKELSFLNPNDIDQSECETWTKILLSNMRGRPITTYF